MSEETTRLEEKIAYLERHVAEQDKAMFAFADELARLKRELSVLGRRLNIGGQVEPFEQDPGSERPPHY